MECAWGPKIRPEIFHVAVGVAYEDDMRLGLAEPGHVAFLPGGPGFRLQIPVEACHVRVHPSAGRTDRL